MNHVPPQIRIMEFGNASLNSQFTTLEAGLAKGASSYAMEIESEYTTQCSTYHGNE